MAKSHSFRVSKIINAPLGFVFRWCTDFREDDPKITGSKTKRTILQKTAKRVIYVSTFRRGKHAKLGVNIVTLKPPNAWHLDFVGEEEDEIGHYKLAKLGSRRTRLDMKFTEKYKIKNAPTKEQDTRHVNEIWNKYVPALESDYARRSR